MGLNILLLLRNKGIILDLELLVGSMIWGATWCSATLGGVWQEIGMNIGADILLRYSQPQFKEMACVCCLFAFMMIVMI